MGRSYTHLTLEARCQIAYLHATGHSIRQIAATLDRAPSSIARELKRNAARTQGYQPGYADQQARARRWQGSKLDRDPDLRATVLARLQHGWSPQQVAGRLALEHGHPVLSHETIYRFIYAQMARKKAYAWRHYLPLAKAKQGRRSAHNRSPASFIACAGPCPAKRIWRHCPMTTLHTWSKPIIIPLASASTIRPPPRCLETICCTSNVNPPPHVLPHDFNHVPHRILGDSNGTAKTAAHKKAP